jgi:hypothetical protein
MATATSAGAPRRPSAISLAAGQAPQPRASVTLSGPGHEVHRDPVRTERTGPDTRVRTERTGPDTSAAQLSSGFSPRCIKLLLPSTADRPPWVAAPGSQIGCGFDQNARKPRPELPPSGQYLRPTDGMLRCLLLMSGGFRSSHFCQGSKDNVGCVCVMKISYWLRASPACRGFIRHRSARRRHC